MAGYSDDVLTCPSIRTFRAKDVCAKNKPNNRKNHKSLSNTARAVIYRERQTLVRAVHLDRQVGRRQKCLDRELQ